MNCLNRKWIVFGLTGLLLLMGPLSYSQSLLTEEKALNLLFRQLKKSLPARGLSIECISVLTEEEAAKFFEFAVREKHGGTCKGDPSVAPIVDRYRIIKKGGALLRYDPVRDSWKKS